MPKGEHEKVHPTGPDVQKIMLQNPTNAITVSGTSGIDSEGAEQRMYVNSPMVRLKTFAHDHASVHASSTL